MRNEAQTIARLDATIISDHRRMIMQTNAPFARCIADPRARIDSEQRAHEHAIHQRARARARARVTRKLVCENSVSANKAATRLDDAAAVSRDRRAPSREFIGRDPFRGYILLAGRPVYK